MREYPEALFRNLKYMFMDTDHARKEAGDVITPLEKGWISEKKVMTFDKVVTGMISDLVNENNVTFFKSVGMALFDIVTAALIYRKAREKGCGIEVNL
jgi:ornithine cyclodeaminase